MGQGTVRLGSTALDAGRTPPPVGQRPGTLQPGALLDGRYRILGLLGTGGMGSVYRAEHEAIGREVAVKVLHPEHCASSAERERFRREARVAVRLRSPHVVETLDFGEDPDGRLFLVMELLQGEPVRTVLAREGQLAPERVVRLLRQLLAGLEAAHAAGIVHRDLKPENLWLDGSGASERLRLLDFGIAKWTGPASGSAQTQAGLVVGTPEYLAPEQAVGGEVDQRADLYSTGVLTFVLLTGRHPFDTRDVRALLAAHAYRAVPSPSSLVPGAGRLPAPARDGGARHREGPRPAAGLGARAPPGTGGRGVPGAPVALLQHRTPAWRRRRRWRPPGPACSASPRPPCRTWST